MNLAQLAIAQAMGGGSREQTGQVFTGDASGGFSLDTSNVVSTGTVDQVVASYGAASAAVGDQAQRLAIAEHASAAIAGIVLPGIGAVVLEYVFANVGPAHGGTGACGDGQPHRELFGTWESNIGAYDATKGSPLTSGIAGSRVFDAASDFEILAYATLRSDYDAGLDCQHPAGPPNPLGALFLSLLKSYNKVHAGQEPVTHVRRWTTTQPGTFGGQQIPGTAVDRWTDDPITLALEGAVAASVVNQPIGNTVDPVVGLVAGRVITVSFTANTGAPTGSTSTNIPKGGSLIPSTYVQPPPAPTVSFHGLALPMGGALAHMNLGLVSKPPAASAPVTPAPSAVGLVSVLGVGVTLAVGWPWLAFGVLGAGAIVGAIKTWAE